MDLDYYNEQDQSVSENSSSGVCSHNTPQETLIPLVGSSRFRTTKSPFERVEVTYYHEDKLEKIEGECEGTEEVSAGELHLLVHDYLKYNGYFETLCTFQEDGGFCQQLQPRSCSRVSEKVGPIDLDPACRQCESLSKVCEDCLQKIMENIEPSTSIKLFGHLETVDLSTLYLKNCETKQELEDQLSQDSVHSRAQVRKLLFEGEIEAAAEFLQEHFPELLDDPRITKALYIQSFIQLVASGNVWGAMEYARKHLSKSRNEKVLVRSGVDLEVPIWEVVGLLCYQTPEKSPLGYLLGKEQKELTADIINEAILQDSENKVQKLLKHGITCYNLIKELKI